MLNDPLLMKKVDAASNQNKAPGSDSSLPEPAMMANNDMPARRLKEKTKGKDAFTAMQSTSGDNTMLAQVVGVIIGSPEFQRR